MMAFLVWMSIKRASFSNLHCYYSFGIKLRIPLHKWHWRKKDNFAIFSCCNEEISHSNYIFCVWNNLLTSTRCFPCICNNLILLCNSNWNSWTCLSLMLSTSIVQRLKIFFAYEILRCQNWSLWHDNFYNFFFSCIGIFNESLIILRIISKNLDDWLCTCAANTTAGCFQCQFHIQ